MPTPTADTPAPTHTTSPQPTADQRLDAMELFLQHLVLVAECEPTFTAEALNRWLCAARQRMLATGSVAPATRAALATLQRRVLG